MCYEQKVNVQKFSRNNQSEDLQALYAFLACAVPFALILCIIQIFL